MIRHLAQREIESLADWDQAVARQDSISGWIIQSVDLSERGADLVHVNVTGAMFLGCEFPGDMSLQLQERGALVFPEMPDLPFNPYRAKLYQATELYDGILAGRLYADSTDAIVYGWLRAQPEPLPVPATLAMALHDQAISDALDETFGAGFDPHRTVGIMGGHAVGRDEDSYVGAARLASQLAQHGFTVVTGGGPGAMEAANLGAFLAGQPAALRQALNHLAATPTFAGHETLWAAAALEVRQSMRPSGKSLGIPTWHYGHEPANVFGTQIAKYFSNAIREDTLLQRCRGGIIYLPGAAGTVQEVFQAATANYYACDPSLVSPMILVGQRHWTQELPAWPLLARLGEGREMGRHVHLVGDVDDAVALLTRP